MMRRGPQRSDYLASAVIFFGAGVAGLWWVGLALLMVIAWGITFGLRRD